MATEPSLGLRDVPLDLVIVGGGIAGLWTLHRARAAGYSAILLEKAELGSGQSMRAQGIIHGGTKYTLGGTLTDAANAIAAMPGRWRACLDGSGEIDLTAAKRLSDATYLWSQGSFGAKMTTLFASRAMRSRVDKVASERPGAFADPRFSGALYRLDEFVLHLPSVFTALAAQAGDAIFRVDASTLAFEQGGDGIRIPLGEHGIALRPSRIVLTSGEGFDQLAVPLGLTRPKLQRRPLHMVTLKHERDLPVFGHCIGTQSTPLVTITTHPSGDGRQVWYLGGGIAETGVERGEAAQIDAARKLLADVLPWLAPIDGEWSTFRIDRAEPLQTGLVRPDHAFAEQVGACIVAWPTKLALSPDLADRVLALLPPPGTTPFDPSALDFWPKPAIAKLPWDTAA
ncbi:FAD-dependent oxidoreductase [Mesorhizobium sp. CAU 1732]|uniref:NAD(P)/FAD-dependent oxidoreductase n=1 Tax=Mesorhizobium sp. CAU 1732 TaxID=3140358 RepID=UPI003260CA5C